LLTVRRFPELERGHRMPVCFICLGSDQLIFAGQLASCLSISYATPMSQSKGKEVELPRKANFARFVRDARIKRHLSVADVAEQVGVSAASIYFWESDRVRPRDANLTALCKVLKLPIKATRELAAE
jgi:DNA-binding XRE family transcriptional regulator